MITLYDLGLNGILADDMVNTAINLILLGFGKNYLGYNYASIPV